MKWCNFFFPFIFLLETLPLEKGVGVSCFPVTLPLSIHKGSASCASRLVGGDRNLVMMSAIQKCNYKLSVTGGRVGACIALPHTTSFSSTAIASSPSNSSNNDSTKHPQHPDVSIWPQNDEMDKKIIKIALPCIANYAINPLVGAVDLFWVGRMGNALAIAGQSAANQVFSSTFWLASYLPSVTATLVSKEHAKGDQEGVQAAVCQAIFIALILGTLGTALVLMKPDLVLSTVLEKNAAATDFAKPYLVIRGLAFFPALVTNIAYSAFRGILDTLTPLKISMFSNAFNAILDPTLIFKFNMGVSGAAVATVAAEMISALAFTYVMFKVKLIRWSKLLRLPRWTTLKPLLLGGAALQLRNLALNITFLSVARVTQSIDNTGVAAAAHSIAIQTFQIGGIVLLALSTVAQTLIPNEMVEKVDAKTGAKSGGILAAKAMVNRLMSWGFILGAFLGAFQIMLLPILHKFTPLVEVQIAARSPSYIASILQIINGLVFIGEGVMIGCGNFFTLSMSTAVATLGILIALRYLPAKFGLAGVWMGFGVFNILRLCGVIYHQRRSGPLAKRNLNI